MAGRPDCSIVIVNYETDDALLACLHSLAGGAAGLSIETIIVDNSASLSGGDLAARFPGVRLIQNTVNIGFGRASNQAIALASGRHVLCLNPDTVVHDRAIATLVGHLDRHPGTGAAGARLLDPDGRLQYSCRRFPGYLTIFFGRYALLSRLLPGNPATRDYLYLDWDHLTVRSVDWVSGACLLVRREVVAEVGPFDPGYALFVEDMDWCRRIRDAGWTVDYVPEAIVTHRIGVSRGPALPRVVWARHRGMWRYVRTHMRPSWPLAALIGSALAVRGGLLAASGLVRRAIRGRPAGAAGPPLALGQGP